MNDTNEEWIKIDNERFSAENGGEQNYILNEVINKCPYCNNDKQNFLFKHFRTPQWTWNCLCGREGYEVMCGDCHKSIDTVVTILN